MAHYSDSLVKGSDREIALRFYYFPFGTKRIPLEKIVEVREHDMGEGISGGRWRIWGSGDFVHWMPLDTRRPKKRTMFILFIDGSSTRPCVTPDHPEAFKKYLTDRGVRLSPLDKPYED